MLSFSKNLSLVNTQAADTCEQVQYVDLRVLPCSSVDMESLD